MTGNSQKADLQRYLQAARDAMLWKLEGLSEYDVRRPMTRTGTNLLGLVKHLAYVELGYFGATFGRPAPEAQAWVDDTNPEPNWDLWATEEEARDQVVAMYRGAWATPTPRSRRSRWRRWAGSHGGKLSRTRCTGCSCTW